MDKKVIGSIEVQQVVTFLAILVATFALSWVINRIFTRFIRQSTLIMRNDPTNYQLLKHSISAVIYVVGIGIAV